MLRAHLPKFVEIKEGVKIMDIDGFYFGPLFFNALKAKLDNWNYVGNFLDYGGRITITSGCELDVGHSENSAHYVKIHQKPGVFALDLRTKDIRIPGAANDFFKNKLLSMAFYDISKAFPQYIWLLERDHVHVQTGAHNINPASAYRVTENYWCVV